MYKIRNIGKVELERKKKRIYVTATSNGSFS